MADPPADRIHISIGGGVAGQVVAGNDNNVSWSGSAPPAAGPAQVEAPDPPPTDHHTWAPVHRTIVAIDVVGSGSRDDQLLLRLRGELRATVARALGEQGIGDGDVDVDDLGDGLRLIFGPGVSPRRLLDPFIPGLASLLREHRKASADAARMRLRVAVHMGLLHFDGEVWAGRPLVLTARMLDADAVRRALAAADRADLILVVSQAVYEGVVVHGYGLDPDTYQPVSIREKETETVAWIHIPGGRA